MALHQGLVQPDARGWSGDAVNTTFRLVNADPLRQVLTEAISARMVFVVSDEIYQNVVRHGHRTIDPAAYLPMTFRAKHDRVIKAWVMVPGYPAPPGCPWLPRRSHGGPTASTGRVTVRRSRRRNRRLRTDLDSSRLGSTRKWCTEIRSRVTRTSLCTIRARCGCDHATRTGFAAECRRASAAGTGEGIP